MRYKGNTEQAKGQKQDGPFQVEKRLTNEERHQVIKWLVELKSAGEIQELIKQEFHKRLTRKSIWQYRYSKKWKPLIDRVRKSFEDNLSRIPCANKVDRLRYYQRIIDEGLKWSLKNIARDGQEVFELKLGAAAKALVGAREEVEPGKSGGKGVSVSTIIYQINHPNKLLSRAEAEHVASQRSEV